jgi:hypothetical protein
MCIWHLVNVYLVFGKCVFGIWWMCIWYLQEHERDMELSFAVARSKEKTCGICMETVLDKVLGTNPTCQRINPIRLAAEGRGEIWYPPQLHPLLLPALHKEVAPGQAVRAQDHPGLPRVPAD